MRGKCGCVAFIVLGAWRLWSAPYVAWVGNVPVHSASPEARIMVTNLTGGATVNVSQGLRAAREPAWAPDGARLAFEAVDGAGQNDLFACRPDGGDRVNLTQTPEVWEAAPVFLDPQRVACLVGVDRTELWVLDVRLGVRTRLAAAPAFHSRLVASPDGRLLAVTAADRLAGPGHLLLVPTDGSAPRTLTAAAAAYSVPAFTPDGLHLVFAFDGVGTGGARRGVAVQPVAADPARLLAEDGYPLATLAVSPDGHRVAYTSATVYHDTWVSLVGIDGSARARLSVSGFHIIGWPGFTPDGEHLVFEGVYAARYTVNLVDLKTGQVTCLTAAGDSGVHPVVSPR